MTNLLVSLSVLLGLLDHVGDLLVGQSGRSGDGDRLVLVGSLVLGGDVDDSISVDVEGDLDLGDTLGRRGNSNELEVSEQLVVSDQFSLSLRTHASQHWSNGELRAGRTWKTLISTAVCPSAAVEKV